MSSAKSVNLIELQPGTRVRLANDAIAEVVENPQDGIWVICRYLTHPSDRSLTEGGVEQPVFAQDIVAVETGADRT
jgi:hypothetical protein